MRLIQRQVPVIAWRRISGFRFHGFRHFAAASPGHPRPALAQVAGSRRSSLFLVSIAFLVALTARAQDNYEIQVYGSETVRSWFDHAGVAQQFHQGTAAIRR